MPVKNGGSHVNTTTKNGRNKGLTQLKKGGKHVTQAAKNGGNKGLIATQMAEKTVQ
jgi:hypothetical protein